ncbi:hypothetical protein ALI22I_10210 [Saccharothrix sp. ALI-22-I]|nr:hypothetical protein ALI22I_10210 [Saccharothrix sp. ALI-22-I]
MLTLVDREAISRGLAESLEYKEIAALIGRNPSVVSRKVARHGGREGYLAGSRAPPGRARPRRSDAARRTRPLRPARPRCRGVRHRGPVRPGRAADRAVHRAEPDHCRRDENLARPRPAHRVALIGFDDFPWLTCSDPL